MGSSQTTARTRVPCIDRRILNHCATREVQWCFLYLLWVLRSLKVNFKTNTFVCGVANTISNTFYISKVQTYVEEIICDILDFATKSILYIIGSRCLTLLVEIHPINNVKVLKAVDSYIWVQVSEHIFIIYVINQKAWNLEAVVLQSAFTHIITLSSKQSSEWVWLELTALPLQTWKSKLKPSSLSVISWFV